MFLLYASLGPFGLLHYLLKCDMLISSSESKNMNYISKLFSAAGQYDRL